MTLRRLENWGAPACDSFTEQKLNSSLCRRGMDELSSRGTKSHWGRKQLIYTHCHRHERGCEGDGERRKMRLIILPAESQERPLASYRGGLSGYDSLVSKEETQRRWGLKEEKYDKYSRNYNTDSQLDACHCIFGDGYPAVASGTYATMLEDWQ